MSLPPSVKRWGFPPDILIEVYPDDFKIWANKMYQDTCIHDFSRPSHIVDKHTDPYTGCIDWQKVAYEFLCIPPNYQPPLPVQIQYIMNESEKLDESKAKLDANVQIIVSEQTIRLEFFGGHFEPQPIYYDRNRDELGIMPTCTNKWTGCIDWHRVGTEILRSNGYTNCVCNMTEYEKDGSYWSLSNPYVLGQQ